MKLIMTLLVRDEADIIASNIDFHLDRGVDFIIASDNLSVDGTTEILRQYEQRGVLRYISQTEDIYDQGRWVTQMARLARMEHAADWVINSDADEFWWPEAGDLKQVLAAMAESCDAVRPALRTNFLPRSMAAGGFFADTMTIRERHSLGTFGQPLQPKVCHRAFPDIEVGAGNHFVVRHGAVVAARPGAITILHFPRRSYRQYANKIAKGGAAYARNPALGPEMGSEWRHFHKLWQRGELEAHYRGELLDDDAIDAGLLSGRLVYDDRLKRFFAARRPPAQGTPAQEAPA
jgi:hypothetical protein